MAMNNNIHDAIMAERERQHDKWTKHHTWGHGDCSSDDVEAAVKAAVLSEECGEVARAVLDGCNHESLYCELVQVAAVAVAWLECLENHSQP